jgi:dienelactone hydrolase
MAVQPSMVNIGSAPQLPAYLAQPEGKGPFPAVLVIFEAFGLNENIKDITRRFAEAGYVALAPDLYYTEKERVVPYGQMEAVGAKHLRECRLLCAYVVGKCFAPLARRSGTQRQGRQTERFAPLPLFA